MDGHAAVRAIGAHIFTNFDVCRIQTIVFESNPASIRVLEKAGYAYEGRQRKAVTKNGITMDALMYALVKEPRTPNPEPRTEPEHEPGTENPEA